MPVVAQLTQDEFDRIMKSFRSFSAVSAEDAQSTAKQADSMFGYLQRPREVAKEESLPRNWSGALFNHGHHLAQGVGVVGQSENGSNGAIESLNVTPYHELPAEEQYRVFEKSIVRYKSNLYGPEDLRYDVWKPMMFERKLFQGGDYSYGMLPEPYVFERPPEPIPWVEEVSSHTTEGIPNSGEMMSSSPKPAEDSEPILRPPQCSINWQNNAIEAPMVEIESRVNRGREIPTRFSRHIYPNGEQIFGGFPDPRFPPPFYLPPHRRSFFDFQNTSPFPFLNKNKRRSPATRGNRSHNYNAPGTSFSKM